jgi:beta-glucosidase
MKRKQFLMVVWMAISGVAFAQTMNSAHSAPNAEPAEANPQAVAEKDVEARVEALLGKMTLEEKIDLLSGRRGFYTLGIERLGIPALKMADGPMGVRNYGPSTAFPAGVALAATWDTEMARKIGAAMAQDARARDVHILLAPAVNINRVPVNGRNFEYFGEDPFLAAQTAVGFIQGVQSQGVIATVKHFALNNQEYQRNSISSEVDERTMHEIYFPAFKAAVQQGKVWAVMCSYNKINGIYASANEMLETEILKKDWGFRGMVMSDWGAAHDGVADALAGLDLEMPSGKNMNRETLLPAVKSGRVAESVIDDKVRRIFRAAISMGFFDRAKETAAQLKYSRESGEVALQGAREGIVLLKNSNHMLPVERKEIHSIAVFGPNAHPAVDVGGGSARVVPFRDMSVVNALVATGARVDYVPFEAQDARSVAARSQFEADEAGAVGLNGEYFANGDLSGVPLLKRRDRQVTFGRFNDAFPQGTADGKYSIRWSGSVAPGESGDYVFVIHSGSGVRLTVDGKTVVDAWDNTSQKDMNATIRLENNRAVPIRLETHGMVSSAGGGGGGGIQFGWGMKPTNTFATESALAAKDDVAIVCVGFTADSESEGYDRTFELPAGQKELIQAITRANKRTIVVMNSGGGVEMSNWVNTAGAVLQAWYTGQESGTAISEIIFGAVNPSGKLPASFEKHWEDSAADANYPGSEGKVYYKEGIFVGYRGFDRSEVKPLFPFGYGLSYTTFAYDGLRVEKDGANYHVQFSIRNTGTRTGAEVAEVYVQPVNPKVERPVKELKGFARVELSTGAGKTLSVDLDRSAFAYYDVATHAWKVDPGEYKILVGASSADIRLTGSVRIE